MKGEKGRSVDWGSYLIEMRRRRLESESRASRGVPVVDSASYLLELRRRKVESERGNKIMAGHSYRSPWLAGAWWFAGLLAVGLWFLVAWLAAANF